MSPDFLRAIAELFTAVAWPVLVLVVVLLNRKAISGILENLESLVLPGGFEAKFQKAVESEVDAVMQSGAGGEDTVSLTGTQLQAAERVARLASSQDPRVIHDQVAAAAREYNRVRASMPAGNERTRQMEKVTTKLRTLGYAAGPLLDTLAASESPGERLAAIAILQVQPDPEKYEWLAERLGAESLSWGTMPPSLC